MKNAKTELIKNLIIIFNYKTLCDKNGEMFVLPFECGINDISEYEFDDFEKKTAFEALQTHIHLMEHLSLREFFYCQKISPIIGKTVLKNLKTRFPDKHFFVFLEMKWRGSFIIRFHQEWEKDFTYYDLNNTKAKGFRLVWLYK